MFLTECRTNGPTLLMRFHPSQQPTGTFSRFYWGPPQLCRTNFGRCLDSPAFQSACLFQYLFARGSFPSSPVLKKRLCNGTSGHTAPRAKPKLSGSGIFGTFAWVWQFRFALNSWQWKCRGLSIVTYKAGPVDFLARRNFGDLHAPNVDRFPAVSGGNAG
jgi:hypothetical protein